MHGIKILFGIAIISALCASGLTLALSRQFVDVSVSEPDAHERATAYYAVLNAVFMDPLTLRKHLDQGGENLVLVDIRSTQDYANEHIVSALSVPAYIDATTPASAEEDRIVQAFREIALTNPSKDIVVYDHSAASEVGRHLGETLAKQNIFVKQLSIGWNEWRYIKTLWNPASAWNSFDSEDYLTRGSEPGIPVKR